METGETCCSVRMRPRHRNRAALPPRQPAPQGRAVVVSKQPRVSFSLQPNTLLANMESPRRVEHGKQVRRQTTQPNATYEVFFRIVCARF